MKSISRRELLGAVGAAPLAGMVSGGAFAARGGAPATADTGAALVTEQDRKEYARLKALNFDDPKAVAKQKRMPVGRHNHEETVAFMQDVKVPWMAYKVLAAGAIPPEDGIPYAFRSGADFICLGFFDFQLDEDVRIARKAIADAKRRKRPWRG